jgi:hypothetical protein
MVQVRRLTAVAIAALLLTAIGCGPTHYQPSGKITQGGEPLKLSEKAVVQIALYPEGDKSFGDAHPVIWDKEGSTFKVSGKTGDGVPAGKYKLSVVIIDPYPEGKDIFGGNHAKEKGFDVEVSGSKEIAVDIPK